MLARDLDQPVRVGRVARADHEHEIALRRELLDGRLAVGRRVTDVVGPGADDRGEALAQPVDDRAGLVDRQRRLRDVGDPARVGDVEAVDILLGLDEHDAARAPRPSSPRPPRGRRGRSARSCSRRPRTSWPRRGPWSRAGRSRRSCRACARGRRRARSGRRRGPRTRPWRPRALRPRIRRTPRRARAAARPRTCCGRSPCGRTPARRTARARARRSARHDRRPRSSRAAPRAGASRAPTPLAESVGGKCEHTANGATTPGPPQLDRRLVPPPGGTELAHAHRRCADLRGAAAGLRRFPRPHPQPAPPGAALPAEAGHAAARDRPSAVGRRSRLQHRVPRPPHRAARARQRGAAVPAGGADRLPAARP